MDEREMREIFLEFFSQYPEIRKFIMEESNAIAKETQDLMKHYSNFVERLDNVVKNL